MHLRKEHAELDAPALHGFIRANPLGLLTTAVPSQSSAFPLLQSTHVPFILDIDEHDTSAPSPPPLGRLRGHIARQNPQARALIEALTSTAGDGDEHGLNGNSKANDNDNVLAQEVLVVFTSPVQHYITTNFYHETMSSDRRTAPTWNYAAAQVYGRLRVHHDADAPSTTAFLAQQLRDLARLGETHIMGYPDATAAAAATDAAAAPPKSSGTDKAAWRLDDAPHGYVKRSMRGIVGLEIEIVRLEGRVKMSQELRDGDREGVVRGLRALKTETAERMAALVEERAALKAAGRAVDAVSS
ncbi:Negative transcriptional regulator family protein [Purpureocillium lavendulum]|uniref:Negative transcriptional regulator family protein n=1 Tax=Purpureocillium lavendulum TaxID=1247861 RepID=A0AB34FQ79_9HYPO|nr:Negative transcriptional regulator family protein [Purpureocillium lavendulum]